MTSLFLQAQASVDKCIVKHLLGVSLQFQNALTPHYITDKRCNTVIDKASAAVFVKSPTYHLSGTNGNLQFAAGFFNDDLSYCIDYLRQHFTWDARVDALLKRQSTLDAVHNLAMTESFVGSVGFCQFLSKYFPNLREFHCDLVDKITLLSNLLNNHPSIDLQAWCVLQLSRVSERQLDNFVPMIWSTCERILDRDRDKGEKSNLHKRIVLVIQTLLVVCDNARWWQRNNNPLGSYSSNEPLECDVMIVKTASYLLENNILQSLLKTGQLTLDELQFIIIELMSYCEKNCRILGQQWRSWWNPDFNLEMFKDGCPDNADSNTRFIYERYIEHLQQERLGSLCLEKIALPLAEIFGHYIIGLAYVGRQFDHGCDPVIFYFTKVVFVEPKNREDVERIDFAVMGA
jgi:hypothetical protein